MQEPIVIIMIALLSLVMLSYSYLEGTSNPLIGAWENNNYLLIIDNQNDLVWLDKSDNHIWRKGDYVYDEGKLAIINNHYIMMFYITCNGTELVLNRVDEKELYRFNKTRLPKDGDIL